MPYRDSSLPVSVIQKSQYTGLPNQLHQECLVLRRSKAERTRREKKTQVYCLRKKSSWAGGENWLPQRSAERQNLSKKKYQASSPSQKRTTLWADPDQETVPSPDSSPSTRKLLSSRRHRVFAPWRAKLEEAQEDQMWR